MTNTEHFDLNALLQSLDLEDGSSIEKKASSEPVVEVPADPVASAKAELEASIASINPLQKQASDNSTKETTMTQTPQEAGAALAEALLTKLAAATDVNTEVGFDPNAVPNKAQVNTAQQVVEGDAAIKPMPTGDGIKNEGSINQILDAMVQDALAQGGASVDQFHTQGVSASEGAVEAQAVPNQVPTEGVEKAAAVAHLTGLGVDFEDAVEMVKAAAFAIEQEEESLTKAAAVDNLMDQGLSFETAVALVKSAGLTSTVSEAAKGALGRAGSAYEAARGAVGNAYGVTRDAVGNAYGVTRDAVGKAYGAAHDATIRQAMGASAGLENLTLGLKQGNKKLRNTGLRQLGRNHLVQGAAGVGVLGAGAGGYALAREKQAAVSALVESGVDFDTAVEAVSAKAAELYGA